MSRFGKGYDEANDQTNAKNQNSAQSPMQQTRQVQLHKFEDAPCFKRLVVPNRKESTFASITFDYA
jgi:hypothetical protein